MTTEQVVVLNSNASSVAVVHNGATSVVGDRNEAQSVVGIRASAVGLDGLSAYEVAVVEGFVGTEAAWLASLVGPAGSPGGLETRQIIDDTDSPHNPTTVVVVADATNGPISILLPAASGATSDIWVKKYDASANAVTVTANGADTIDGAATAVLTSQFEAFTLSPFSTEWMIF